MGEKLKSKAGFFVSLLKSAIIGVVVSILLVLILAFVLKFVEINDRVISIFDEAIKVISIMIATTSLIKKSPYKILFKSATVGAVYSLLTFLVFSALRGEFSFSVNVLLDIVLGAVVGIIFAIIISIFKKEKVNV